jgi:hypothetical protein
MARTDSRSRSGSVSARRRGGRYTPPTPRAARTSPKWLGPVIIAVLLIGVLMIVLNYFDVLPDSPTNWYLLGGIIVFAGGFAMATQWH